MQNTFAHESVPGYVPSAQQARDTALLHAATELFLQEPEHDRDEIRRYEELARHLLPQVSPDARAVVAERLASRPDAPKSLIRMLAKDQFDVARHVIGQSPVLESLDLLTIIAATGPDHHRLVAGRPDLGLEVLQALRFVVKKAGQDIASGGDGECGPVEDGEAPLSTSRMAPVAPPSPGPRPEIRTGAVRTSSDRLDVWSFLGLDPDARLRLLAELATRPPVRRYTGPSGRLDQVFRTLLSAAQIIEHARRGRQQALIDAIAKGLELETDVVAACLDDASGEPAAVLLKGLGLNNAQAQQVLLLATPTLGLDVQTFFRLTNIYADMEPSVAAFLIDAWSHRVKRPVATHVPHFAENSPHRRQMPAAPALREEKEKPAVRTTGT